MSLLGNIIWLVLGGLIASIGYILGGIAMCLTIVGIPFGIPTIKLGITVFAPFGKRVVKTRTEMGCLVIALDLLWLVLIGWLVALTHLISGVLLCITIIGIPFGMQHFKLIPVALMPLSYSLE